jgi:hypothetical protein
MDMRKGDTMKRLVALLITLSAGPAAAQPAAITIPWTAPSGQGLGIGYEIGQWGQGLGQGLRLRVPIHGGFGAALRGVWVAADDPARLSAGGRLDLYGQSPVFLNLIRLYGSGGIQLFRQLKGDHKGATQVGAGGQFGFEFFMSPRLGLFLEVGGSGNAHLITGATVIAGMTVYPGW